MFISGISNDNYFKFETIAHIIELKNNIKTKCIIYRTVPNFK